MKITTLILILQFLISCILGYRYSLPGDENWPSDQEFIDFAQQFDGRALLRGQEGYAPFTYNIRTNYPEPAIIVYVQNKDDIKACLAFAKLYDLRISVQSTGHHQDIRNTADNSLLIHLGKMQDKKINMENKTITVQTGSTFGEIFDYISKETNNEYVIVSGADPSVGPYGWAVGGGHGRLTRMYGLGVDNIVEIDLIKVDGEEIIVNQNSHPELFRAMRGSGGSPFGVAVSITFLLHEEPGTVTQFNGVYLPNDNTAERYADWLVDVPNNAGAYYITGNYPSPYVFINFYCFGSSGDCHTLIQPFKQDCIPSEQGFCEFQVFGNYYLYSKTLLPGDTGGTNPLYMVSTALNSENLKDALIQVNKEALVKKPDWVTVGCYANSVLGGVSTDMDPDGTETSVAPAMRKSLAAITCFGAWPGWIFQFKVENQQAIVDYMKKFDEEILQKYGTDNWVYWNEPNHDFPSAQNWQKRYWGSEENYQSMLKIKQQYDPENFLTCYHCIGWDLEGTDPAICPEQFCKCLNTPNGQCANDYKIVDDNNEQQEFLY